VVKSIFQNQNSSRRIWLGKKTLLAQKAPPRSRPIRFGLLFQMKKSALVQGFTAGSNKWWLPAIQTYPSVLARNRARTAVPPSKSTIFPVAQNFGGQYFFSERHWA